MSKLPKVVPWLAAKYRVSETRAEELWADALRAATLATPRVGDSEFWRISMQKFVASLEAERSARMDAPFRRWSRISARMWLLPLSIVARRQARQCVTLWRAYA
ncbi:MAG: hypothetical protein KF778_01095 [Rhodocyclaceae bacterium]|nr:hypothetical protein [Rhodocyclaceae bacterium]MBX3666976.1 hypothetical protein [Rhodocyclaceae bacterium]